ncbi:hypothetical protein Y032_0303g1908 [Ancylostoma ceylanicum]|uniref:Uncharacterized protein n=1 Tax=Ancylostoma ceylanicum TaxID=53326 RepID=A0A016S4N8_9BILA|nr:hypothetical protein Y032_0303g1908 [Ancylostoma ceylanicum]
MPDLMATLKKRQLLTIGTINVRSLRTTARQLELDHAMKKTKCDILDVTKARIEDQGIYILPSGTILFHSGGMTAHGDVAFLVHQSLANDMRFTPMSDRLATLHHPSLNVFLVLCYAPASSNDNYDEYENYLEEVERICRPNTGRLHSYPLG